MDRAQAFTTGAYDATAARDPDALPGPVVRPHDTDEDPYKLLVEPPTGLTAKQGRVDGEVKLSWNAPAPTDDIEHHDYRYHTGGRYSAWVTIPASDSSSNHVGYVSGLTGGVAHTFQVRAIKTNGDPSLPSATATATPRGAAAPTSAGGTRSPAQAVVTLELSPFSIDEGSGVSTVTASLDSASAMTLTVTVSAEPVAPAVAGDFTLSANRTLAIAAGDLTSTGSVTISAVDNTSDAPDKEVTVSATVAGATDVTGPTDVTLTITDDDEPAATICAGGRAGVNLCSNVDLMSHLALNDIGGGVGSDIWGWQDSLTGKEYAIMGRSTGTAFVDVSDPLRPIYLGNLPPHSGDSQWRDMKVYLDHAFIVTEASDSGMQVFDLAQLRTVSSPPVTFSETAHYSGFSDAHNIAINEDSGFAYAVATNTCGSGLHMINIQSPTNPTSAGCFSGDGYTHDAQCVNYMGPDPDHQGAEICFNSNTDTLTIVDVTNKAAPEMLSRTGYTGSGYAHQGWLTDDHTYFVLGDEFDETRNPDIRGTTTYLWDVRDLDSPALVGTHVSTTRAIDHNQYVKGKYTYQSNYQAGLRILDVTDIANGNLTEVAFFDMVPDSDSPESYEGTWGNYPFFDSGIVIVSERKQGLFVLRPNLVDRIQPKVGRAVVDRETLTLNYGEALDETSKPTIDAFAVTVEGAARSVSDVSVSGSAVALTLASGVTVAEEVTLTYTVPETSPIRDEAKNNAPGLSSRAVRNNTLGPPGTPEAPTVTAASATSLTVTWAEPPNAKPAITDYDVQYRVGSSGGFTDWPHAGTALTATIPRLTEGTAYEVQVLARNPEGMSGWSDSGSGTPAPPPNIAPTASATATTPTTVNGGGKVTLDGTASDPEGDTLTYAWTSSGGGTFDDATVLDTTWTAPPKTSAAQDIVLTLTVTDDGTGRLTHAAEVNVRVRENQRPTASVSPGAATVNGGGKVTLDGTASDPDTTTLTYAWASSGGGTFDDASALDTTWTAPPKTSAAQDITLTLTVTDDGYEERAATETVQVTVRANRAPNVTATATTPTTVNGGGAVMLDGRANDPDGDGLRHTWSSSGGGSFDNASALDPTWTAPPKTNAVQNIVLTLTVTEDRVGARAETANVDVTVGANQAPRVTVSPATVTVDGGGTVRLVGRATDRDDGTLTYRWRSDHGGIFDDDEALVTPWIAPRATAANERVVLTLTVTDSTNASASATASGTVRANQAPRVTVSPATVTVDGGGTVTLRGTATDPEDDDLTYFWSSNGGGTFNDDAASETTWTAPPKTDTSQSITLTLTVTDDGAGSLPGAATVDVTVRGNQPLPPPIIGGGGFAGFGGGFGGFGGGGGPTGPTPSEADFEWTVTSDLEALDGGHDKPSGQWSDGATLWVLENGDGADDAVYAYDLKTGERVEGREFELDERNRAPRGVWSDRTVLWVSDSGRNRLFAHDLASGERLPERDLELAERNRAARGIWSADETMFVLDGGKDSLFAYDLASGELLAEYALDSTNDDPHGIWSDGVTFWVSDDGAKRLFAYRLEAGEDGEAELERNRDEEFPNTILRRASNNSPRGIWSDGDVMYVADESDDKVYSYNMPDAIDARLASLTLSGVEIGEFDPGTAEYKGVPGKGVAETTVGAEAMQRRTDVAIDPIDADVEADGHQVGLEGPTEITVTVTSADGSRERVYRVTIEMPAEELELSPTWTSVEWPGVDGAAVSDALGEGGIADDVVVIYHRDETTGIWLAYFPDLVDVPGLNTLTTLTTGETYWIAVSEPVTWTVETAGGGPPGRTPPLSPPA